MHDGIFALVMEVSREAWRQVNRSGSADRLTETEFLVLRELARADGALAGDLSVLLDVEPNLLNRSTIRLERANLIQRRPALNHEQGEQIFLAPEASPLVNSMSKSVEELFEKATHGLSTDARDNLQTSLVRIRDHLRTN